LTEQSRSLQQPYGEETVLINQHAPVEKHTYLLAML